MFFKKQKPVPTVRGPTMVTAKFDREGTAYDGAMAAVAAVRNGMPGLLLHQIKWLTDYQVDLIEQSED